MAVSLPPLSRRQFLATSALAVTPGFAPAVDADPHRVALLSDTHIGEKADETNRDCNMQERLKQVAAEVARLTPKPACVVINGDLAHKSGTTAEYELFAKLIDPVRKAELPLHLALGNHDNFTRFAAGLANLRPADKPVEGKQVVVVELERANLIILDSFDPKGTVGGRLGEAQLKWLGKALDERKAKPAVVFVHHPLQEGKGKGNGIEDSADFWPVLKGRPHVKAFVFGHTHTWKLAEKDGIHLVNLPAVGYPFSGAEVTGWVDAAFTEKGMRVEVHALDPKHAKHRDKAEITWRKG